MLLTLVVLPCYWHSWCCHACCCHDADAGNPLGASLLAKKAGGDADGIMRAVVEVEGKEEEVMDSTDKKSVAVADDDNNGNDDDGDNDDDEVCTQRGCKRSVYIQRVLAWPIMHLTYGSELATAEQHMLPCSGCCKGCGKEVESKVYKDISNTCLAFSVLHHPAPRVGTKAPHSMLRASPPCTHESTQGYRIRPKYCRS